MTEEGGRRKKVEFSAPGKEELVKGKRQRKVGRQEVTEIFWGSVSVVGEHAGHWIHTTGDWSVSFSAGAIVALITRPLDGNQQVRM